MFFTEGSLTQIPEEARETPADLMNEVHDGTDEVADGDNLDEPDNQS